VKDIFSDETLPLTFVLNKQNVHTAHQESQLSTEVTVVTVDINGNSLRGDCRATIWII